MSQEKPRKKIRLTVEQSKSIDEARASIRRGEGMAAEQAHEVARAHTKAWIEASVKQAFRQLN